MESLLYHRNASAVPRTSAILTAIAAEIVIWHVLFSYESVL